MSAPAPLRAATVAGAILATAFIVLSAIVGGINAWRTHSASTYEAQAEQAQSDKATVDQQITEAQAALDAATVRKDAESWCNSITRESTASIRDSLKTYDSATQATKDAIHEQCAAKETLAQVYRTNKDADFSIAVGECTTDQVTTTVNGTLTLKDSSQIASLGALDVEINGFTADKGKNPSPGSPYQGTTTITLTPGSPATFTLSIPYDPAMTDKTECGATMTSWWPSNL